MHLHRALYNRARWKFQPPRPASASSLNSCFSSIEPMPDQSSTFRRVAKTTGRIFLLAIVSIAIGAFGAAFLLGYYRELGGIYLVSGTREFAVAVLLIAAVAFAGLVLWQRGDRRFLWALVSVINGAFVASFTGGLFHALIPGERVPPELGLSLLKVWAPLVAAGTFAALLWWRRSDGSLLWPIVSIAIGPLFAAFLPAVTSTRPPIAVSIIVLMVLPVATGIFAGWRWWRRGGD